MDYKHLIRFFLAKLKKDNIGAYAAQAALFIIMSAIPFLLVFLSASAVYSGEREYGTVRDPDGGSGAD